MEVSSHALEISLIAGVYFDDVVAREYRITSEVGTGNATTTFKDGQLIEVDGDAGVVRLVVEAKEYEPALVG
ncbi:MAG: PEP-utilizing enzyme [Anaerolineales bacterium]